jgi:predicted phage terminase large subunit-like protein
MWEPPEPLAKLQARVTSLMLDGKRDYADALMREACLAKPYGLWVLLRYGLARADAHNQWVFDRCLEVMESPDGHLDLWAREHYKSTIITFALTIQNILRNSETTIGIFSHTRPIAKAFLRQIKQEMERNERLKRWFPDVLWADPSKESPKWSEDEGITVKRKGNPKEATVEAWGLVDGQPTSKHFDVLNYDDIVVESSVGTPEMIKKTTDALSNSYNLGKRGGKRRFVGTRYHYNDTYREIMDRGTVQPRLYPATIDGTVDGTPVFLTREELSDKRRDQGPYVFGCFAAGTPVLMSDWTEKAVDQLQVGDEVVGYRFGDGQRARLVRSKVLARQVRPMPAVRFTFASGRTLVCTEDHKFWHGRAKRDYAPLGLKKGTLRAACSIYDPAAVDVSGVDPEARGYLRGIFDGEGCVSGGTFHITQCAATNPEVCAAIGHTLDACDLDWEVGTPRQRQSIRDYYIVGGREQKIRFARLLKGAGKSARLAEAIFKHGSRNLGKGVRDQLVSIEPVGDIDVYNVQTETGNYVAAGYAVKNCQMLQDPTADDKQGFKAEWLRYAGVTTRGHNLLILVDPASKKKPTSDYTSMWLIGLGPDRKVYVHDMLRDRLSLTQRAETLIKWHRYWSAKGPIQAVAYEEYGLQADIEHAQSRMEDENYRFDITPVGGRLGKLDRIRRLIPWFEQGRIYLPAALTKTNYEGKSVDLVKAFKNEEYLAFPVAPHDDMLDALARFLDDDLPISFPLPIPEEDDRELEMVSGRNVTTGY